MIWIGWYNKIIWAPFFRRGNWMMIFIYAILLIFFMNTYGGFKVGFLKKGNLIYSQILAVLFTNIVTYFQITVQDKRFTTPVPLGVNIALSVVAILVWTLIFQWIYGLIFPPRRMLLISGDYSDYHLLEKMNAREDKYIISQIINYKEGMEKLIPQIDQYDGIIVGDMPSHERNLIIKYCYAKQIRTYSVPKISDILLRSSVDLNLFDSPLLLSRNTGLAIEQMFCKRLMDVVFSLLGLVISAPFFLLIAISIKLTDRGPVFYKQTRLTKDGKTFEIYKFRTMIQNAEKYSGAVLASEHDPRILLVGRLLRATRLDELPQIFNIFKGDMSIVGPRPALWNQDDLVAERDKYGANDVTPGLTGWAQINGRDELEIPVKAKLDGEYVKKYGFTMDVRCFFGTFLSVLRQDGVVEGGTGSMKGK